MTPILQNERFSNYAPFKENFDEVFIYKIHKDYVVFKDPYNPRDPHGYIFYGNFDTVNGWLYGAVMAANKIMPRRGNDS